MKHCIIVKWNDKVTDKCAVAEEVKKLYDPVPQTVEGVKYIDFLRNCIDRPNRYDLAIVIHMDSDALPRWDESEIHKRWKSEYGDLIASKTIFDFE
jgi:hypothetical protein